MTWRTKHRAAQLDTGPQIKLHCCLHENSPPPLPLAQLTWLVLNPQCRLKQDIRGPAALRTRSCRNPLALEKSLTSLVTHSSA